MMVTNTLRNNIGNNATKQNNNTSGIIEAFNTGANSSMA
jgi:hypothetical protein